MTWDCDRYSFVIPFIHYPVTWYGIFFATGFFCAYLWMRYIFASQFMAQGKEKIESMNLGKLLAERLTTYTIIGTVIGARLGHVLFYGWPYYREHPLEIFKIWEGGLASHGAAVGILLALVAFTWMNSKEKRGLTFLAGLDAVVVVAALPGAFIRLGNFVNQEILGLPTSVPWGVIFLHPVDGPAGTPVHPVQLYEAFFYFFVAFVLWFLWKRQGKQVGKGLLTGVFFILVFGFRIFIEFFKQPQSLLIDEKSLLMMGQWLSIPFVVVGCLLLIRYRKIKSA